MESRGNNIDQSRPNRRRFLTAIGALALASSGHDFNDKADATNSSHDEKNIKLVEERLQRERATLGVEIFVLDTLTAEDIKAISAGKECPAFSKVSVYYKKQRNQAVLSTIGSLGFAALGVGLNMRNRGKKGSSQDGFGLPADLSKRAALISAAGLAVASWKGSKLSKIPSLDIIGEAEKRLKTWGEGYINRTTPVARVQEAIREREWELIYVWRQINNDLINTANARFINAKKEKINK